MRAPTLNTSSSGAVPIRRNNAPVSESSERRNNAPLSSPRRNNAPSTRVRDTSRGRMTWLVVGDIAITLALVFGLFVFWDMKYTNFQAARAQDRVTEKLKDSWSTAAATDSEGTLGFPSGSRDGDPVGIFHIPRFGDDWSATALEGIGSSSLSKGPGRYSKSQIPGEIGNSAFAAHRDGSGAFFHKIDQLDTCDPIVFETSTHWLTFRVLPVDISDSSARRAAEQKCLNTATVDQLNSSTYSGVRGQEIVLPTMVESVSPVPGRGDLSSDNAELAMMTLTSCHPVWSNRQRMVVHAVLSQVEPKAGKPDGFRPEALTKA